MAEPIEVRENNLVLHVIYPDAVLGAYLFPQALSEEVWRSMGHPTFHTYRYTLTAPHVMDTVQVKGMAGPQQEKGYILRKPNIRGPLKPLEGIEQMLRTRWLGRSADTIDEDIRVMEEILQTLKREATHSRFPTREPGEA